MNAFVNNIMASASFIVVIILVLFGVIALFFLTRTKKKIPTDYYALFVMGLIGVLFGIITGRFGFITLGLVLTIIGLVNKDKWKKNRRTWDNMSKEERRLKLIIIVMLGLLVLAGLVFFLLANKGII